MIESSEAVQGVEATPEGQATPGGAVVEQRARRPFWLERSVRTIFFLVVACGYVPDAAAGQ